MRIAKHYVLCGLMVSSFCVMAMEFSQNAQVSFCVEEVRNKIDTEILGISRDICFRGILGSICSYFRSYGLSKEQAAKEMEKIESYITFKDKKIVLKKLAKRHWYVNYVMHNLVEAKLHEVYRVQGSTIDELYNPVDENSVKSMIHTKALKMFFDESGINNVLERTPIGTMNEIHFVVLRGHESEIKLDSLIMSADSKYLQSTDSTDTCIIWDMQQGVMANDMLDKKIQWQCKRAPLPLGKYAVDWTDTYAAISGNSESVIGEKSLPLSIFRIQNILSDIRERSKPAIILFKRPEEVSYLCQKAFINSYYHREGLIALSQSKSFEKLEGFPKENLKKLLETRHVSDECLAIKK